jgi:ABC-type glutathione transport system ATPase component
MINYEQVQIKKKDPLHSQTRGARVWRTRLPAMHIRAVSRNPIAGATPAVSMRGLGLTFATGSERRRQILANIDLDVDTGEFVCIVGPSGAGKTTLLQMLAGLAHPTAGEVRFYGKPITGPSRERAIIFQDYSKVDPDVLISGWMATGDWVRKNVEVVAGFRAAIDDGLTFIKANPDEAREIQKKYIGFNSPRLPTFENKARPEDLKVFIAIGTELGLYRTAFEPEKLVLP